MKKLESLKSIEFLSITKLNKRFTSQKLLLIAIVVISLFLIVWVVFGSLLSGVDEVSITDKWQPLIEVMDDSDEVQDWAERLVRENYVSGGVGVEERESLRVKQITSPERVLYLVDFNNLDELCGRAGCLYTVYADEGERVLAIYLQDWQDNQELIVPGKSLNNGFPDLIISQQVEPTFEEKFRYVYQDGEYIQISSKRVRIK